MDKALLIALLPAVTLFLVLGWIAFMAFGRRRIHLRLKGLGVDIQLAAYHQEKDHVPQDRSKAD